MPRYATTGLFVLLAALWGASFVATRAALPDVPPVLLAGLRFDIAGVLMLGYAAATTSDWYPATRADWYNVALGGLLFVALHHALLFAGQQYVTSAVAAVVVALDPVLAAGFSRALLPGERLSRTGGLGLLFGALGVGIIARPSPDALLGANAVGVALVGLAAAAFALGAVVTRRSRTDLPVQSMQAWMMLVGAPLLHFVAYLLPGERLAAVTWSPQALAGLGYLSVIAAGVGYLIYFELLDRLGPIEINLVGYVTPAFAAVGGWVLLGEPLGGRTVVGFGAVAAGFVLVKWNAVRATLAERRG